VIKSLYSRPLNAVGAIFHRYTALFSLNGCEKLRLFGVFLAANIMLFLSKASHAVIRSPPLPA
jgi:hypothetical protein